MAPNVTNTFVYCGVHTKKGIIYIIYNYLQLASMGSPFTAATGATQL
jgi:hypothetical protein